MIQERYFLEIESFSHDREPEIELVYAIEVHDFELKKDQIIFKNCLNSKILDEMTELNLLKRSKKVTGYSFCLNSKLYDHQRCISDYLGFPYEFNYTESDLTIYDFSNVECEEDDHQSLRERVDFFLKQKQFLKLFLENKILLKQWFDLNEFDKECWLIASHKVAVNRQMTERIPQVSHIILDGHYIHSENDLYCAIGEEVCGIFGYMGYTSSALRDCLTNDDLRPTHCPLTIIWKNFKSSEQNFNCMDDLNYLVQFLKEYSNLKIEL